MPNPSLILSIELFLVYVLRASGVHGRMTSGRVERIGPNSINVYDERDAWIEYFSGEALRRWCILTAGETEAGKPRQFAYGRRLAQICELPLRFGTLSLARLHGYGLPGGLTE